MKITIIRHQKVKMKWPSWCDSVAFDQACMEYDVSEIFSLHAENVTDEAIYVSGMRRSADTAKALFPNSHFILLESIREVPLRSFWDCKIKLPLWIWNVMGRVQWKLCIRKQQESFEQTRQRALEVIKYLESKDEDCILVTHGFFMRTLIKELKKKNYKIENGNGPAFTNLQRVAAYKL